MKILFMLCLLALPFESQAEGILDQAIQCYKKGDYQKAINLLTSDSNAGKDSAEQKIWLGKSYIKVREWDKAVEAMEEAVKLKPSNAKYHLELGRAYGARADDEGPLSGLKDAGRLKEEFEKARELDPKDIDVRFDLLEFNMQAPWPLGSGKKAKEEAEAIAKLNPKLGYTARAIIYERKKKWDKAEKEYKKATQEYPKDADVHKDFAQFLFRLDPPKYREAWEAARKVLELNPESKQGLFIEAACGVFLGRNLDQAEQNLRRLAAGPREEDGPAPEEVYYWLGMLHYRKGERDQAREAFAKALEIRPGYKEAEQKLKVLR